MTFFQFHHTRLAVILKTWFNVAPKNTYFFTGKWELFTHISCTGTTFCAVPYRLQYSTLQCCGSGSGAFLNFGSELGKKSRSGSGMNIPDHISERLETIFWFQFDLEPDPECGILLILDPGWNNSDPGFGINIPDPQDLHRYFTSEVHRFFWLLPNV